MNKKEFAQQMLKLLTEFQNADEPVRKRLGKTIAEFFRRNERLDNNVIALNDPDFEYVGFAAELTDYRKETFSEDDLEVAKSVLGKVIKSKK